MVRARQPRALKEKIVTWSIGIVVRACFNASYLNMYRNTHTWYVSIYTYIIRSYTVTHPQSGLFHCSITSWLGCLPFQWFFAGFCSSTVEIPTRKNPEIPPRGAELRSVWERVPLQTCLEAIQPSWYLYHYMAKPHVLRLFGGKSLQRIGFATFSTFILAWYGQFPSSPSIWRSPTIWSNLKSSST